MEISTVVTNQFLVLIPVALVIVCAVLVFAFGFKSSVEPPNFSQLSLSSDERKTLKKKKLKDKKAQSNGHATIVQDDYESKKSDQSKALKQSNKIESVKSKKSESSKSPSKSEKKPERKVGKENQVDNRKGKGKSKDEKPVIFSEWETVVSKKDKKKKKEEEALASPKKTNEKAQKKPQEKSSEKKKPAEKVPEKKNEKKSPTKQSVNGEWKEATRKKKVRKD